MALAPIMNVIAGLVLAVGILEAIPAMGKYLKKLAVWLGGFQAIIGVITLIVGILEIGSLNGIVAILAGLILMTGLLPMIPAVGKSLEKFAKWLGSFQLIIGIIALLVGLLTLLNIII